jgi:hypothetical protein
LPQPISGPSPGIFCHLSPAGWHNTNKKYTADPAIVDNLYSPAAEPRKGALQVFELRPVNFSIHRNGLFTLNTNS